MVLLKKSHEVVVSAFFLSILSACGGGSSSSDSVDADSATTTTTAQTVFNGTQNLTITAAGLNETDSAPFQLAVDGNTVTISAEGTVIGSGALSGSNFNVSASDTLTDDGITCSLTLNYAGSINGSATTGSISGNGTCSDGDINIPITIAGNFNGS